MRVILVAILLMLSTNCFGRTGNGEQTEKHRGISDPLRMRQPSGSYVHGTIDLVISTRTGFVLATDSRATSSDGSHADNAQKLFTVGQRAAAVVAGVVGAEIGMQGFGLRDAIATHLLGFDQRRRRTSTASDIAQTFEYATRSVAGLLLPGTRSSPALVAGISTVSINLSGQPEWVTLYLPLEYATTNSVGYFTTGTPIVIHHSLGLGLRFDVQAIGFPFVVEQLLTANQPGNDEFSSSEIMRQYYQRKAAGHLDEFTINEAIDLAKVLIQATYRYAPGEAGVGGPIDIATLTTSGITWIARKTNVAPPPPPYALRFFGLRIEGGSQPLDGLECVRCTFKNARLTFSGEGNVQLLAPQFLEQCSLTIKIGASRKMPQLVEKLKALVTPSCTIIDEDLQR